MKIKEVLTKLEQSETDTKYSKEIFNDYEEGKQDKEIKKNKNVNRRDWFIIADIYNNGNQSQKFHLKNYLEFRLKNGLDKTDDFEKCCYRYFRNAALVIYIREVIFKEPEDKVKSLFENVKEYYKEGGEINRYNGLRK